MQVTLIKTISKQDIEDGIRLFDEPDKVTVEEMDLAIIGIQEGMTRSGKIGVVFAFHHEGSTEWKIGTLTEGLMDGLCAAYKGAKERFKQEKNEKRGE